ncbi:hypothetical protein FIE12Z_1882 [Fusarium flagelliforme]|uniref:RanBP2-type domain-containing protein n=1 Tax=Fusarium flagelliforme TaxID=2675880 RepID=A0A395N138_9HYPO|nr:hypothetical protein FIE12Z_1882 [Fusarium flagelliforme]
MAIQDPKDRPDHTQWLCTNIGCHRVNNVKSKYCSKCRRKRCVKAKAMNYKGERLGELTKVDDGVEVWEYKDEELSSTHI